MRNLARAAIVVVVFGFVGCTPVDRGVNDPSEEPCGTLTYENFAADFFDSYCLRCHSEDLTGLARSGAPSSVNFDTLDLIRERLDRIGIRAGSAGSMPPSEPFPTSTERAQLLNWIDCGALTDDEAANLNDNSAQ